jgi:hypothetical protein
MIQIRMVQPGTGEHQKEKKELQRNSKGKIVGRMDCIKQK